jgi:lipoate-protein ligase A
MIADFGLRIADSTGAVQSAIHNPQSAIVWHLIIEPAGRSGPENMAIDAALLDEADRAGTAFLRVYRWEPACLSFGRNEAAAQRYDRAAIERRGIVVVRRPTGGRAVWHEHEVTYAVAAPVAAFGSLRDSYRAIHTRLAAALHALGVHATLAPRRPPVRPSAGPSSCFATPAGGEILVSGRKLVGSAQVRRGTAFLQHGSILLDGSQAMVNAFSRQPSVVSGGTTLRQVLGRAVTFAEVTAAIVATWGAPLLPSTCPTVRPPRPLGSDEDQTWRR